MTTLQTMYNHVTEFHQSFNHPCAKSDRALPYPLLAIRTSWMFSELFELSQTHHLIGQIDALVDFLYFQVGTLVVLTPTCPKLTYRSSLPDMPVRVLDTNVVELITTHFTKRLIDLLRQTTFQGQLSCLLPMIKETIEILETQIKVDSLMFFEIVHTSNMSKAWPDGVRYDKDNKVLKSPQFQPPEPQIELKLHRLWTQHKGNEEYGHQEL